MQRLTQGLQVGTQFRHVLVTRLSILFERLGDDLPQFRWEFGVQFSQCHRCLREDGIMERWPGVPFKCAMSCRHFIQYEAKGKQVRSRVQFFATCLFWRHVTRRAHRHAGPAEEGIGCCRWRNFARCPLAIAITAFGLRLVSFLGCTMSKFGQSKIQNLGLALAGHKNVGWLYITMDDALLVRGIQSVRNLDGKIDYLFEWQRISAR